MKKTVLLLVCTILLSGCMTANKPADAAGTTVTDPANPIEVQAGETFNIVLASNPSTGYHWELVGELGAVEFVASEYKAEEPVMPGSGGVDVWIFKAVSAGEAQITLGSYPPGVTVTDGEPEQTVTFNIVVK